MTKARVSFPRRESYGLEARFKVIQVLVQGTPTRSQLPTVVGWVSFQNQNQIIGSLRSGSRPTPQVWVESRELEMLRSSTIDRVAPR